MRKTACLGLLLAPFGVLAHHSPAAFDQTAFVVIEGTVAEFTWANPHVYFSVETTNAAGERYVQSIEAGPPSQLLPRGMTRDLLRVGDPVKVRANPNRRGPGEIVLGVELTTADGSRFPLHARALRALGPADAVAATIEGSWVPQPEGYLGLRTAMGNWPTTEAARAALASGRARVDANSVECIPAGPPALMANSGVVMISIDDDTVTFDIDIAGRVRRLVHLGAEHPVDLEPTWLGHSIGRWDERTLVVDSVGFRPHAEGMGFAFPSSEAKHIVERFALSSDGRHLDYEITIEDPVFLTAPVSYRTQWDYRPELVPPDAPCDPATARRFLEEN